MYDDFELDDIDCDWEELDEQKQILSDSFITSMDETEFRLYINNKLDTILLYLRSISDVLSQKED